MSGDTYIKQGLAIINPYGGIWTNQLFDTPEDALAYLKSFWKEMPMRVDSFKLAMATQTVTLDRSPGEPTFIDLPAKSST